MTREPFDEEVIFHKARQIDNRQARVAYLDQVCEGAENMRERIESLLSAHEMENESRKSRPNCSSTIDPSPMAERESTHVGPYKLMEVIGEGGFGTVFVADQQKPIRRKVALKVIKPGNALVSTQDGRPLAKVIDFGIGKATQTSLTDKTLFTDYHQLIGTPAYTSPEQANPPASSSPRSRASILLCRASGLAAPTTLAVKKSPDGRSPCT